VQRGLARATVFTWERTARLTDGAVAELLGDQPGGGSA
jgi:hypothetical protein